MEAVVHPVTADGRIAPAAQELLQAVSGVPRDLLERTRIRPAHANWLRAPWYGYHRGGAMTIGTTIHFTRIYFDPTGHGDGRIASTWKWMTLLAHEVGHLPQAARFGLHRWGTIRYITTFVAQYGSRALTARSKVHDGSPLEIEADLGRWVLLHVIDGDPLTHPVVQAVHANDVESVRAWCNAHADRIRALQQQYRSERMPRARSDHFSA